ncbi:ribokinase-like [Teleopsis dalmanni]|uniref:ribokinase-like n=1 Tax=Teleopsis dalmanni TaxID=139649 RepID=UPI0018CEE090|nr:ribokinase-like [Teleopsis dalmanni]
MTDVDILVFGATAFSIVWQAKKWPTTGQYLPATSCTMDIGGRAASQSLAAAKLGAKVALITRLGTDDYGNEYLECLQTNNIKTEFVTMCDNASTAVYQKTITENGVTETFFDGAINLLCKNDLENAKTLLCEAKVLICQQEVPTDLTLYALRKFKGISILNASPHVTVDTTELLKSASIICLNGTEATQLVEIENIVTPRDCIGALDKIIGKGAKAAIILLGPIGCVYALNGLPARCIHVPIVGVLNMELHTFTDAFIGALAYLMTNYPKAEFHQKVGGATELAGRLIELAELEKLSDPDMPVINKKLDLNINLYTQCYQWENLTRND